MKVKLIIKRDTVFLDSVEVSEIGNHISFFVFKLNDKKDVILLKVADEIWLGKEIKIVPETVRVTESFHSNDGNETHIVDVVPKEVWKWVKTKFG